MSDNPNLIPGVTDPGNVITYTNAGADIKSRDVVIVGDIAAVALVDIPSGSTGSLAVEGIYAVAGTGTINQGSIVNATATGDPVTTAAGTALGFAVRDKHSSGDVAVKVCPGIA